MRIQIFEPFSLALRRMTDVLFRNFDLRKWLVVGFTAFLAELVGFGEGGSTNFNNSSFPEKLSSWADVWEFPGYAWDWLMNNLIWFFAGIVIFVIIIALIFVLLWLSSRGKFMFLYNVVEDKAEIGIPWKQYRFLGNSLFVFRTIIFFISAFLSLVLMVAGFFTLYAIYDSYGEATGIFWLVLVLGVLLFFAVGLIFVCIDMFISDFLVPIMYKFDITAIEATRRLNGLISQNIGSFILYTLLKFGLSIAVFFAIMMVGLMTCCIGFLILAIPYINTVILLPIYYTFRSFSVEFLEQFGSEYKLFPDAINETGYNNY